MKTETNTQTLIAGATAAFTVDLLIYPLDTLKTRIQSQDYIKTYTSSTSSAKSSSAYAFRGLYQGVGSVIIATLPAAGIFFTVYESSKYYLSTKLTSAIPQPAVHSLASAIAELSSCVVLTPAEVIKQNAQMIQRGTSKKTEGTRSTSTSLQAWRDLQRAEGGVRRRLWSGYTALAARNLPFTAIHFPVFEAIRERIWRWRHRTENSTFGIIKSKQRGIVETGCVTALSAAISGSFAAILTTPTDVVKTRMMLLTEESNSRSSDPRSHDRKELKTETRTRLSGLQVAKQIFAEKGMTGLLKGGTLRAAWTAVGSGLYLGTYEMAKVWLKEEP